MLAAPHTAYAAGSGGSSTTKTCSQGYIYSTTKKKCVLKQAGIVPDRDLIAQGWALAYSGQFEAAIEVFSVAKVHNQPSLLNGLGYSYRKSGQLDRAVAYYKQAISLDPDYVLAREYLGEGYVSAGKLDLARAQLNEIEKRCGTGCKVYTRLASIIDRAKTRLN